MSVRRAFLFVSVALILIVMTPSLKTAGNEVKGGMEVLLCNPLIEQLGMSSTWEAAKAVGVKGIEIHVESDLSCSKLFVGKETPYRLDSRENAWRIRNDALKNELLTPVLVAPILLEPKKVKSEGAPSWALQLIEVAPVVGAELIYFPIVTDNFTQVTIPDEEFIEASVFLLNDLVSAGNRHGVEIALENLSVYWNRAEILDKVLFEFAPDELGVCLDPINFYWYGHPRGDVYKLFDQFVPRAKHFHAKNVKHNVAKREVEREPGWKYSENSVAVPDGDLDFERMIGLLVDADYDGYIGIEDDSLGKYEPEERLAVLRKDVEYVRRIVKGYNGGSSDRQEAENSRR